VSVYEDREQTQAKHFILRGYLQELAFKVLHGWDLAYIDGFSGPWESKTDDFSDTSFMIALTVLRDAQTRIHEQTGKRRRIRCFFSEKDAEAHAQLSAAVAAFHDPAKGFEVRTFKGEFVDAVGEIRAFVGSCFPLIFIDPTGWTGYPFATIASLFTGSKCEVLINFMYGHVSRFIDHPDERIIASLDPILGGPGWKSRLDPDLKPGPAVEKLFRETLKAAGRFAFVVSTKIDKSTQDRPHFFLAYGTKDRRGLIAFRETELRALKLHARSRSEAKARERQRRTAEQDMFATYHADLQEQSIDDLIDEQKVLAKTRVVALLHAGGPMPFEKLVDVLLPEFMLRETNVKDLCVALEREGIVLKTWGSGNRKPQDPSLIQLVGRS
jgi:three-Cys-motif partner protein